MLKEWYKITSYNINYVALGLILILMQLITILNIYNKNSFIILGYFLFIWILDMSAYICGKLIGGPKLIIKISPGKTVSGFLMGITLSSLVAYIYNLLPFNNPILLLLYASLAQISDILVSFFKRKAKVKDSGSFLPGHGGVLDRFDAILLTVPIMLCYL